MSFGGRIDPYPVENDRANSSCRSIWQHVVVPIDRKSRSWMWMCRSSCALTCSGLSSISFANSMLPSDPNFSISPIDVFPSMFAFSRLLSSSFASRDVSPRYTSIRLVWLMPSPPRRPFYSPLEVPAPFCPPIRRAISLERLRRASRTAQHPQIPSSGDSATIRAPQPPAEARRHGRWRKPPGRAEARVPQTGFSQSAQALSGPPPEGCCVPALFNRRWCPPQRAPGVSARRGADGGWMRHVPATEQCAPGAVLCCRFRALLSRHHRASRCHSGSLPCLLSCCVAVSCVAGRATRCCFCPGLNNTGRVFSCVNPPCPRGAARRLWHGLSLVACVVLSQGRRSCCVASRHPPLPPCCVYRAVSAPANSLCRVACLSCRLGFVFFS